MQLNNRSDEAVQVGGFCDRPLERLTNSGWVTVDGASGICTAALLLLPPGSSVALSYPTRGVRLSGTYRLRVDLRRLGAERPFFQYSNDFSIDAE